MSTFLFVVLCPLASRPGIDLPRSISSTQEQVKLSQSIVKSVRDADQLALSIGFLRSDLPRAAQGADRHPTRLAGRAVLVPDDSAVSGDVTKPSKDVGLHRGQVLRTGPLRRLWRSLFQPRLHDGKEESNHLKAGPVDPAKGSGRVAPGGGKPTLQSEAPPVNPQLEVCPRCKPPRTIPRSDWPD